MKMLRVCMHDMSFTYSIFVECSLSEGRIYLFSSNKIMYVEWSVLPCTCHFSCCVTITTVSLKKLILREFCPHLQYMVKSIPAPSSLPVPLLHITLDPWTCKFVACRIVNDNLYSLNPAHHLMAWDFLHLVVESVLVSHCSELHLIHKYICMCFLSTKHCTRYSAWLKQEWQYATLMAT